jgi:hypothetical protein
MDTNSMIRLVREIHLPGIVGNRSGGKLRVIPLETCSEEGGCSGGCASCTGKTKAARKIIVECGNNDYPHQERRSRSVCSNSTKRLAQRLSLEYRCCFLF